MKFSFLLLFSSCKEIEPSFEHIENHHLHNFQPTDEAAFHAKAMGYQLISEKKPQGPEYDDLGLILSHNTRVGPVRIYIHKLNGKVLVKYQPYYLLPDSKKSAIANEYGMYRESGELYPLLEDDWFIIKSYSATRREPEDIRASEVNDSVFYRYFSRIDPDEDEYYYSFNLSANWQSRKVAEDFLKYFKEQGNLRHYDALVLDGINNLDIEETSNKDFGDMGHYSSAKEGQQDFIERMTSYVKTTDSTGRAKPMLVFGNLWNPKAEGGREIIRAYSEGRFIFDHFYYGKGGVGEQLPDGVIPEKAIPAYVVPEEPDFFLPASKVSMDDVYDFNSDMDIYNREEHFTQHLDACGTAGITGAWFGWFGEDCVIMKDADEKLIYTNDLQLLRAIPNWDNLWGIPVPSLKKEYSNELRTWKNNTYKSVYSYASNDVIYSVNPFNKELYVVFRNSDAEVDLNNKKIIDAHWCDDWFLTTDSSAMRILTVEEGKVKLRPQSSEEGIMKGLRLTLK